MPSGAGGRRCLGESLACAEIGAVLPTVLRAVRWRPIGSQPERMVLRDASEPFVLGDPVIPAHAPHLPASTHGTLGGELGRHA
jgi:hypothetical protein